MPFSRLSLPGVVAVSQHGAPAGRRQGRRAEQRGSPEQRVACHGRQWRWRCRGQGNALPHPPGPAVSGVWAGVAGGHVCREAERPVGLHDDLPILQLEHRAEVRVPCAHVGGDSPLVSA